MPGHYGAWWQEKAQRQEEGHEEGQQEDAVQLWQVKTSQLNKALYSRVKAEAKRKFDGLPQRVCKCVAGARI